MSDDEKAYFTPHSPHRDDSTAYFDVEYSNDGSDVPEEGNDDVLNRRFMDFSSHSFKKTHSYLVSPSPPRSPPSIDISMLMAIQREEYEETQEDDVRSAAEILFCMSRHHQDEAYPLSFFPEERSYKENWMQQPHHRHTRRFNHLTLALPEDPSELNSLHCFVRKHLLEIYVLDEKKKKSSQKQLILPSPEEEDDFEDESEQDDDFEDSSYTIHPTRKRKMDRNTQENIKQNSIKVGLQCVHCSHLPRKHRSNMSTVHPKNLSDLYRSVCTWQRVHFHQCHLTPDSVRDTYWKLKTEDKTRGKTRYWLSSARKLGLIDCPTGKGIRLRKGI